jgi:glyoxylase-like metal-dependent hydrolase (beta-lactamase superfamily II)
MFITINYNRIALATVFGWVALLSSGAWSSGTEPASIDIEPLQLHPRVWYFRGEAGMATAENQGFMSNSGFVVGSEGIAVFDTLASPALGEAMRRAIRRVSDKPIAYVITSHYHADHFYGLQAFADGRTELLAHARGRAYLDSPAAQERLLQRREALAPWVDSETRLLAADRWLDFSQGQSIVLSLGDLDIEIIDISGSHSDSDIMMLVQGPDILFAGDLYATGRLPYVAGADTRRWLEILPVLRRSGAKIVVPGHGGASRDVERDIALTEKYLRYLRSTMAAAVEQLQSFDEAYAAADWSEFENLPAFREANRRNAYSVFLEMEQASFD